MAENKVPTLEELAEKVHSGLELGNDEIDVLFGDVNDTSIQEPAQPAPAPAPTPAPRVPTPEPAKGQADDGLLNRVPEKFRDKDAATSIEKMSKSYGEVESELARTRNDLSELQRFVQQLSTQRQQQQYAAPQRQVQQAPPEEEVDDAGFYEKPVENTTKIAQREAARILAAGLMQYDQYAMKRTMVDSFKASHPDFDQFRTEMGEVLRENPQWEADPNALPRIYDAAKRKAASKLQLVQPQTQNTSNVDIEKLKAEWMQEAVQKAQEQLLEGLKKRKAAAGALGGSAPTTVQQRVTTPSREKPLSFEEQLIKEMRDSGPKLPDWTA